MTRAGIVLCGGLSRRMGRPKALLPWFGRSLIEHVVALLAPCVDELIVVTSEALSLSHLPLEARIVVDREPARGPLAALRDGLAATRAELAFVTASDAPFLTADHVAGLFERALAASGAAAPIADDFVQVLSAVYPARAWRDAEILLTKGISSPTALLERIGFVRAPADAAMAITSSVVAPWTGFNTPDAYLALARKRDPEATAIVEWWAPGPRVAEGSPIREDCGAVALAPPLRQAVPIGRLGDVLERAAPPGLATNATPGELLAAGRLRVVLAEGELAPGADAALPIGPGERVRVHELGIGDVC